MKGCFFLILVEFILEDQVLSATGTPTHETDAA